MPIWVQPAASGSGFSRARSTRFPRGLLLCAHMSPRYLLGADPGGKGGPSGNFGWALVEYVPFSSPPQNLTAVHSGVAPDAQAAMAGVLHAANAGQIVAIGVDGPLGYDAKPDRAIDAHIRAALKSVGASPGSPGATNSLRGACLVQAVVFALLAQQTFAADQAVLITESYPRAVRDLPNGLPRAKCAHCPAQTVGCHECDATLAAGSAWACAEGKGGRPPQGWQNLHSLRPSPTSKTLKPQFMVVPGHEYWLPV